MAPRKPKGFDAKITENPETMSLSIQLNRQTNRPLYQQIALQIQNQISRGQLPIGSRLPPVRQLAQELQVTRLTVHSAYNELQADGWVESVVGRGTFVASSIRPQALMADIGQELSRDGVIDDRVSIDQITGLRSMAYAYPEAELLPAQDFWDSLVLIRPEATDLMQYGSPWGDARLRIELAANLQGRGIKVMPDDIIVTSGLTHAGALVARTLTKPGDTVLIECPSHYGTVNVFTAQGLQTVGVPRDDEGPRLDILEKLINQQKPRFFFTIPNFHNPTGLTTTLARRQALLSLAEQYGLWLIEDDIYGRLAYDELPPPPLKALDQKGLVIYVDSFSKDLLPGVRIGYMIVPPALRERLPIVREAMDIFGPQILQRALADFLQRKKYKQHLRRVVPIYRIRRQALLDTLAGWMPEDVLWTRPGGGFSCWLTLPQDDRLNDLYHAALNNGLAFTPGSAFMSSPDGNRHLRLCFGNQTPEVIRDCVILLSDLIRERLSTKLSRKSTRQSATLAG